MTFDPQMSIPRPLNRTRGILASVTADAQIALARLALVPHPARFEVGARERACAGEGDLGADAEPAFELRGEAKAQRGFVARRGELGADGEDVECGRARDDDLELGADLGETMQHVFDRAGIDVLA